MQDLHRDLAAGIMDAVRHYAVVGDVLIIEQASSTGKHAAFVIGGHAASNHQAHAAARAGGIKFGDAVPVAGFFEPGMHGPHQHAVFQRGESKVKR